MAPGASSNPTSTRSDDVSPIVSSLPPSNAVDADVLAVVPPAVPVPRSAIVADSSQSLASLPELAGSSVPPSAPASLPLANRRSEVPRRANDNLACLVCGGDHHISVCQECDP
jgi:hypothetical protein